MKNTMVPISYRITKYHMSGRAFRIFTMPFMYITEAAVVAVAAAVVPAAASPAAEATAVAVAASPATD